MTEGQDHAGFDPPDIPPPPPRAAHRRQRGSTIFLAGVVFGFSPLLLTLVASIFVDDALNEGTSTWGALPWLTILTLPVGALVALLGLTIGARNVTRRDR